jgi:hypothetical protein
VREQYGSDSIYVNDTNQHIERIRRKLERAKEIHSSTRGYDKMAGSGARPTRSRSMSYDARGKDMPRMMPLLQRR